MSAPIIHHDAPADYRDAPGHPIPSLAIIDVMSILEGGGARLYVVIAAPMSGDEYSQKRLLDKIEGYLGHIASPEFRADVGDPSPESTAIVVKLHPDSDSAIHELLARCGDWVRAGNARLVVESLTPAELGATN